MSAPPKTSKINLFYLGIILVVTILGFIFLSKIQDLGKKNKELLAKSKLLETTLNSVKTENQAIIDKIQNEKMDLKNSLDSLRKENESLRFALTKVQMQYDNAIKERRSLEEMLVNKNQEIEETKPPAGSAAPNAMAIPPSTPKDIANKLKEKDAEIKNLGEQNKILSDKLDKLYKIMNEKITQISIAKIALEETVAEARKKISEEWNTVNLGSIDVTKQGALKGQGAVETPAPSGPKKEGKVLAVNENQGFVVVDMGKVDNITTDTKLVVKHDGKYVATLSILEIRDIMSACHIKILEENQKIQLNDQVTIRK